MKPNAVHLTAAEVFTAIPIAVAIAIMLTAHVLDASGWPIDPGTVLILVALELAVLVTWTGRTGRLSSVELDRWGFIGWVTLVAGLATYLMWLARPAYLPLNQSPDMIHHLNLIGFIQQRHSLTHDGALWKYLGEFTTYPSGSHVLAALVADWFYTSGLRVLHPILSVLVAAKAGLIFNVILRLLPQDRRNPAIALAGTLFLLFAWGYFLLSFIGQYYYAQVVAETFVIAMLWAMVKWNDRPSPASLGFFAFSGLATLLTWPVWLPVPVAAMTALIAIRETLTLRNRITAIGVAIAPIALVGAAYAFAMRGGQDLLMAEGLVLVPRVESYGRLLLTLVAIGFLISLRRRRARALVCFAGAAIVQTVLLFAWDWYHGVTSYYLAYKMVHLLLYPMVLFAALALDALWHAPARWWPGLDSLYRGRLALLGCTVPLAVLGLAVRRDLPSQPYSAINEPVYRVGVWAKTNLPAGCVDYVVDHWATAYWLHVNVLGNARVSERSEAILKHYVSRTLSAERWMDSHRLPYAIVNDMTKVPADVRARFVKLYEVTPAAVVERLDGTACREDPVPLDRVAVADRGLTLAQILRGRFNAP